MNNSILPSILAGALSGVASGVVVGVLLQPTETDADSSTSLGSSDDLSSELIALRDKNESLDERLAQLESRENSSLSGAPRAAVAQSPTEEDLALEADLREIVELHRAASEVSLANPGLYASVEQALVDIRDQEEADRRAEAEAARVERLEERLADAAEKLGLDGYQMDGMRTVVVDSQTLMDALMQQMRDGDGDWGDMRDQMGEIREQAELGLQGILTAEQWEQMEEERLTRGLIPSSRGGGRDFGGFGGGGGGFGGGGGGRGGGRGGI